VVVFSLILVIVHGSAHDGDCARLADAAPAEIF